MFIESLVGQEGGGFDIIWILLPLLCCLMLSARSRGGKAQEREGVTESWFIVHDIDSTYKAVEAVAAEWRKQSEEKQAEPKSITSRLRGVLGGGRTEERFVEKEAIPPRLYRMTDPTGPIYFELTEVEGGGTVVKATYSSSIKGMIARFKAGLPLKIPAAPIGNRCPTCGKPVLPEFNLCPYCGEKIITKE